MDFKISKPGDTYNFADHPLLVEAAKFFIERATTQAQRIHEHHQAMRKIKATMELEAAQWDEYKTAFWQRFEAAGIVDVHEHNCTLHKELPLVTILQEEPALDLNKLREMLRRMNPNG